MCSYASTHSQTTGRDDLSSFSLRAATSFRLTVFTATYPLSYFRMACSTALTSSRLLYRIFLSSTDTSSTSTSFKNALRSSSCL